MSRTIIETLNIPDVVVTECKDEAEFVQKYSGHWWNFDDEKLKKVYQIVMNKTVTPEGSKGVVNKSKDK